MNIIWIKTELLHPLDKGGRIRTFNIVRELARKNRVTYLCYADPEQEKDAIRELSSYVDSVLTVTKDIKEKHTFGFYMDLFISLFSPNPYTVRKYYSRGMTLYLRKIVDNGNFDVIVCDFLAPSLNFDLDLRKRSVFFQHNVESLIWERHVKMQNNIIKRGLFYQEWKKLERYEKKTCQDFKLVLTVSKVDRELLKNRFGVDHVLDIPTGVDLDYFRPLGNKVDAGSIVFTGSMDWLPNVDAVNWFAKEIMPLIRGNNHSIKFMIVGRKPTSSVLKLAREFPDVEVTGEVKDVRPYIDKASVFVVPIRIGGGTRLKIFEAMAMGKVVVSTTIGAEGLPVKNGEHLLLADTPQDFVRLVNKVIIDKEMAKRVGLAGRNYVVANYSWERVSDLFLNAISDLENFKKKENNLG